MYSPRFPTLKRNPYGISDSDRAAADELIAKHGSPEKAYEFMMLADRDKLPQNIDWFDVTGYLGQPDKFPKGAPARFIMDPANNSSTPATLQSISDYMHRNKLIGAEEGTEGTAGRLIANMNKPITSMEQLLRSRHALAEDMSEHIRTAKELSQQLNAHGGLLHQYQTDPSRRDYKHYLTEALNAKQERGPEAFGEFYKDLGEHEYVPRQMEQYAREVKPDYFEAKPRRGIGFDEFAGAVVDPNDYGMNHAKRLAEQVEDVGIPSSSIHILPEGGDNYTRSQIIHKNFGDQLFSKGGEVMGDRLSQLMGQLRAPRKGYSLGGQPTGVVDETDYTPQIDQLYQDYYGRAGDKAGLDFWNNALRTSPMKMSDIEDMFSRSNEAKANYGSILDRLYNSSFGRNADQAGKDYWTNELNMNRATLRDVENAFADSPEAMIRNAYKEELGRDADDAGLKYWNEQFAKGDMDEQRLRDIMSGTQEARNRGRSMYDAASSLMGNDPKRAFRDVLWSEGNLFRGRPEAEREFAKIGHTIINRANVGFPVGSAGYRAQHDPHDIMSQILAPGQFSYFANERAKMAEDYFSKHPGEAQYYEDLVNRMMSGELKDPNAGSMYYLNEKALRKLPSWFRNAGKPGSDLYKFDVVDESGVHHTVLGSKKYSEQAVKMSPGYVDPSGKAFAADAGQSPQPNLAEQLAAQGAAGAGAGAGMVNPGGGVIGAGTAGGVAPSPGLPPIPAWNPATLSLPINPSPGTTYDWMGNPSFNTLNGIGGSGGLNGGFAGGGGGGLSGGISTGNPFGWARGGRVPRETGGRIPPKTRLDHLMRGMRRGYEEGGMPGDDASAFVQEQLHGDEDRKRERELLRPSALLDQYKDRDYDVLSKPSEDAGDFVKHELSIGERQLPQMDRAAKNRMRDLGMEALHLGAYATPAAPAMAAYDAYQGMKEGDPTDLFLSGFGVSGRLGKLMKGLGAGAMAMQPAEAQAAPKGKLVKNLKDFAWPMAQSEMESSGLKKHMQALGHQLYGAHPETEAAIERIRKSGSIVYPGSAEFESIAQRFQDPMANPRGTGGYYGVVQSEPDPTKVKRDFSSLRGLTPTRNLGWEQFFKENPEGTMINLAGDRTDVGKLRGIQGQKFGWEVPIHGGPKYSREINPNDVWANNLGINTALLDAINDIKAATKKPVYGVYAPMGPQAMDSSKDMVDAIMSQFKGRGLDRSDLNAMTSYLTSGEIGGLRPKDQEAFNKAMAGFPGLHNPEEASQYLQGLSGGMRRTFTQALDTKANRERGAPEIGMTRVAMADPNVARLPGNTLGPHIVELTGEKAAPAKRFANRTYEHGLHGRYVGDVEPISRHVAMPDVVDVLLGRSNAKGEAVHPFSTDRTGFPTYRKLTEEQVQPQTINQRMIDSILAHLGKKP